MNVNARIKRQIEAEIEVHKRDFSDIKIYTFLVKELVKGDTDAADQFMLSPDGGYTPGQLNEIKRKANRIFNKQSKAASPVIAF